MSEWENISITDEDQCLVDLMARSGQLMALSVLMANASDAVGEMNAGLRFDLLALLQTLSIEVNDAVTQLAAGNQPNAAT